MNELTDKIWGDMEARLVDIKATIEQGLRVLRAEL